MKRVMLFVAALAAVSTVLAGFRYEGEWSTLRGFGPASYGWESTVFDILVIKARRSVEDFACF